MLGVRYFAAQPNDLEREFRPQRLGNWEVPKWYPQRPRARKTTTKIIVNDRGHLLPGVQRQQKSPWGNFQGTWQLPNKISRKLASELTRPNIELSSWEKRSAHVPIIDTTKLPEKPKGDKEIQLQENNVLEERSVHLKPIENKNVQSPPLNSLDPIAINNRQLYSKHDEFDYSRPVGYDKSTKVINTTENVQKDIETYNKTCQSPLLKQNGLLQAIDNNQLHNGNGKKSSRPGTGDSPTHYAIKGPPLASVYCSSLVAKNLALDNQKHQPLPDTVEDAMYRSLQLKQNKNPGMGLNIEPRAAAIGCKGYGAPGPTQCSKLKVYRPKTAGVLPRKEECTHDNHRPKTSGSKRPEHMTEMQLALCWDLKPAYPGDEPKRSPHIDGSNGSAAPAVFSLVHQEPPEENNIQNVCGTTNKQRDSLGSIKSVSHGSAERQHTHSKTAWGDDEPKGKHINERLIRLHERSNPSAVMDIINNNATKENSSPNIDQEKVRKSSSNSRHSRRKSLNGNNSLGSSDVDSQNLSKRKHYQSSPNLSSSSNHSNKDSKNGKNRLLNSRPCMACEHKESSQQDKPKSEYKMAFKAGKPNNSQNSNSSQESSPSTTRPHTAKHIQIPKPKAPFAKRSYSIGTLAPPFSVWPGTTGQDYPEHWRLASVYQHSYKPVETRRKTLLQSVYQ